MSKLAVKRKSSIDVKDDTVPKCSSDRCSNFDDSSDEDESIESYDIKKKVAKIQVLSGYRLSYITQALGIYMCCIVQQFKIDIMS
jgi:hypothetical protein